MANVTDSQTIEGLLQTNRYGVEPTVVTVSATTTTLSSTSTSYYILDGSTPGQIVKLGSATTYGKGFTYLFHNQSSTVVSFQDNAGTFLFALNEDERTEVILKDNTSSAGVWVWTTTFLDILATTNLTGTTSRFQDFDQVDFHQHHQFHFTDVVANGGTVVIDNTAPTDNTYMGLVTIGTGTTSNSTGRAMLDGNSSVNNIKISNMSCEWRVKIPTLSTGTVGFQFRTGVMDANTAGDSANGIIFYYSEDVNSGKWVCKTINSSTTTTVNTSVTVAANTWYKLRWVSTNDGATVNFFVDSVLVGASTTNIPTTNATRVMSKIEKKSPSSTTTRTVLIDWLMFGIAR
jgi:hypothetical protein